MTLADLTVGILTVRSRIGGKDRYGETVRRACFSNTPNTAQRRLRCNVNLDGASFLFFWNLARLCIHSDVANVTATLSRHSRYTDGRRGALSAPAAVR